MYPFDRPADGLFAASDFRVRYELIGEGVHGHDLGGGRFELCAGRRAVVHTLPGRFGPHQVRWQLGEAEGTVHLDGVCYAGTELKFDLEKLGEVVLVAGLELLAHDEAPAPPPQVEIKSGLVKLTWSVAAGGLELANPGMCLPCL